MATSKEVKLFLRFLKDNGIYSLYRNNFHNVRNWQKYINNVCSMNLISDAFLWDNTQEGFNFWIKYHREWQKYLIKK